MVRITRNINYLSTTVSIGMICAQRLLREIDNVTLEAENIVLSPELIIRNSVKNLIR